MSASTWGNPNAAKHALLIHGITSTSQTWHRIAHEFAVLDYFVTAPDLLGHGNARRGSDYTIAALADELRPYFTAPGGDDHPYDLVIGYSLGGLVASAVLPLLKSTRPVQVVLCDPPLEQVPEAVAFFKSLFSHVVGNRPSLWQELPSHTREDAILAWLGTQLCDVAAVEATFDAGLLSFSTNVPLTRSVQQNDPWSFSHLLSTVPGNVKVTVLAADPTKGAVFREEHLKGCPHVTTRIIWGASHLILNEAPEVVVKTALQGIGALD